MRTMLVYWTIHAYAQVFVIDLKTDSPQSLTQPFQPVPQPITISDQANAVDEVQVLDA